MPHAKILMIVGDYVEDYEVMVPFQALQMVGHIVHAVCPDKKAGQQVRTAIHDFEGDQTYSEKRGHNFTLNASFDECEPEHYDALVLPGGRAPEYLRLNPQGAGRCPPFRAREETYRRDLPCRTIAHGGGRGGRETGQRLSGLRSGNRNRGRALTRPIGMTEAIADGALVTAPAWPAHAAWLAKFLEVLEQHLAKKPAANRERNGAGAELS